MTSPSNFPPPKFADLGGRRIAYDEVVPLNPRGTVLLLTGLGSKRQAWARQLPAFGQQYRTIAIDHRDVGDSDAFEQAYTVEDQADDAAKLLGALNVDRAHVMGISMGGFIALNLAARHTDRVESLVLVATSAGGEAHVGPNEAGQAALHQDYALSAGERARRTYTLITAPGFMNANPEAADAVARVGAHNPMGPEAYRRQYQAIERHDVGVHLANLHVPTLVVHGDLDPLIPYENGQRLAREIPNAHLITYAGVGHIPITERAEQFNEDALNFLQGVTEYA